MTLMAAEAGEGAFEAEASDSAAAGRQATARPRTGGRTQQGAVHRTGGRTQQGTSGTRRVSTRVIKATPEGRAASFTSRTARPRPRPRAQQAAPSGAKTLTGNYHGAVFVEFVLAVVLVAGLPFAKPNQTGVSPYAGSDMIKLLALTALYFLLALMAATGRTQARFAAWFGALILLGIGLSEGNAITTAVRTWLPGGTTSATSTASSAAGTTTQTTGNASVVNAPSTESATGISRAVAQEAHSSTGTAV